MKRLWLAALLGLGPMMWACGDKDAGADDDDDDGITSDWGTVDSGSQDGGTGDGGASDGGTGDGGTSDGGTSDGGASDGGTGDGGTSDGGTGDGGTSDGGSGDGGSGDGGTAVEDCSDGADNDGDGLADCEDDDCIDVCLEDCTDEIDNDADGLIDCDDDECFGEAGCGAPYVLTATYRLDGLAWGWGSLFSKKYGDNAAAYLAGDVVLRAEPDGWKGSAFTCRGYMYGISGSGPYSYTDLMHYVGPGTDMDYEFLVTPSVGKGLYWDSSCAVSSLPSSSLGMVKGVYPIYRYDGGAWVEQYTSRDYYSAAYGDGRIQWLYDPTQIEALTWEGEY